MFRINSLGQFNIVDRGLVFVIESPVQAKRNYKSLITAIGNKIEIDGQEYKPIGFGIDTVNTPVHIGEHIEILVTSKVTQ